VVVQVAPYLLAVNQLAPYTSWRRFFPLIKRCFRAYEQVATPTGFRRIGMRYINKIEIPETNLELSDYFTFYPHVRGRFETHGAFIVGVLVPYDGSKYILNPELHLPAFDVW
jgi:uncharacterized protein (TIGR04255 family)